MLTVNAWAFDVSPDVGLNTVILNVPAVVRSVAGMVAVSCVLLTNGVVLFAPLNCTTEFEKKFVPFTVIVKEASPTVLLDGEMFMVVGTG